jgi:hypothetical protein
MNLWNASSEVTTAELQNHFWDILKLLFWLMMVRDQHETASYQINMADRLQKLTHCPLSGRPSKLLQNLYRHAISEKE